jgi:hypothetical protein
MIYLVYQFSRCFVSVVARCDRLELNYLFVDGLHRNNFPYLEFEYKMWGRKYALREQLTSQEYYAL